MGKNRRKAKKLLCGLIMLFFMGGAFLNSGYVNKREEEVYQSLKDKYADTEVPVTEVEESNYEEVVENVVENVEVSTEPVEDNRTNEQIIWDYLKDSGFTDIQTSAIIGNLYQESRLNPAAVESNGQGFGIAQWSFGRKAKVKEYCKSQGKDETDLICQLEYLVKEIKSREFYEPYKSTFNNPYSIDDAVKAYCYGFERPDTSKANIANRTKMAWNTYYNNIDR